MKPTWTKASRSNNQGNCVEVARLGSNEIGIRDSKDPNGAHLAVVPVMWNAFLDGAKHGEFDL